MKIAVLTIGNEILDGIITESNSVLIANELASLGLEVREKLSVRDEKRDILQALKFLSGNEIIIITGGLGPTEDDKTRECAALFLKKKLELDEKLLKRLSARFIKMKIPMPEENKKQALVIEGSEIIPNPYGTAPGFIAEGKCLVAAFPGVPSELKMMLPFFMKKIKDRFMIKPAKSSVYIQTIGLPESFLDQAVKDIIDSSINMGTIAHLGQVTLRLDFPLSNPVEAQDNAEKIIRELPFIEKKVFSYEKNAAIQETVLEKLIEKNKKVLFAESCTGGLVSKILTDVPGSSGALFGSIVSYDNRLKKNLLGVKESVLKKHGAVSFETARAMTEGLKKIAPADYRISVTGIAGPEGGSEEKPVGTVYIGFGRKDKTVVCRFQFGGLRESIRMRTAMKVFELLWEDLTYGRIDIPGHYGIVDSRVY